MGMIDTSRSALLVFQRALDTTSHNIANVFTEGYSRQTVNLSALGSANPTSDTSPGSGVTIKSLDRAFDQILTDNVRHDSATFGRTETFAQLTEEVDLLFANSESGLAAQTQNYFSALQEVSNDPTSIANRQVLLGEADMLTARFGELDNRLDEISVSSNLRLTEAVSEINSLGQQIADINSKIQDSGSNIPLDLLDARDHLVDQLSEQVSVNTIQAQDGTISLFAGDGQALVIGNHAETLGVVQSEYPGDGLRVVLGNAKVDVTEQMSGGVIGGVLDFQNEVLRPAQNEIGRLAVVLAENINELHREGYDLDGNTGSNFFNYTDPQVVGSSRNTGTAAVTASFVTTVADAYDINGGGVDSSDVTQLMGNWQASDYELVDNGATWSLTRLSDNTSVDLAANANGTVTAADGFVLNINLDATVGTQADGDRFLIRPFQNSAGDISVAITEPREFAAANAIDPAYELEYLGADEWRVTRLSDGHSININDGATDSVTVADGFNIDVTGITNVGATFQIHPFDSSSSELTTTVTDKDNIIRRNVLNMDDFNTEANPAEVRPGNNENALALANLQTEKLMSSGTTTMNDTYNQLVSVVGIKTSQAKISMAAQGIMLDQSIEARSSVSGVNLDEEAADLIRYQQAYQAAAKVMAAADQMFKTLLNSLG